MSSIHFIFFNKAKKMKQVFPNIWSIELCALLHTETVVLALLCCKETLLYTVEIKFIPVVQRPTSEAQILLAVQEA